CRGLTSYTVQLEPMSISFGFTGRSASQAARLQPSTRRGPLTIVTDRAEPPGRTSSKPGSRATGARRTGAPRCGSAATVLQRGTSRRAHRISPVTGPGARRGKDRFGALPSGGNGGVDVHVVVLEHMYQLVVTTRRAHGTVATRPFPLLGHGQRAMHPHPDRVRRRQGLL